MAWGLCLGRYTEDLCLFGQHSKAERTLYSSRHVVGWRECLAFCFSDDENCVARDLYRMMDEWHWLATAPTLMKEGGDSEILLARLTRPTRPRVAAAGSSSVLTDSGKGGWGERGRQHVCPRLTDSLVVFVRSSSISFALH